MGCVIARNEAIAAGVASLPDPMSDPDAEWLYYFAGGLHRENRANVDSAPASLMMPFDVRGQRIIRVGSSVVWIAAVNTGSSGVTLQVTGRYLVKLT